MSDFQRIADEEEAAPPRPPTREIAAAHVRDFVDEVVDESSRGFSFQRVSDEEESPVESKESPKPAASPAATKKESLGSRRRKKAGVIGRLFKAKKEEEAVEAENETTGTETSEAEVFPDSGASVTSGRSHEEFATRRGGRRRRRPKQSPAGVVGDEGKADNDSGDDIETTGDPFEAQSPEMTDDPFEVEETQVVVEEPEETPPTSEIAKAAPRDIRRAPPSRGRRPARRERTQPAITDLLREGQEILVQIAKEPIAKKGARITSHIALHGRFLV
jgi:Ribonuclease G/E